MDITIKAIAETVIAALRAAGYMESTIDQYCKCIKALELVGQRQDGIYTKELGDEFAAMTTSPRTGEFSAQRRFGYGRLIRLFNSYVDTGSVNLEVWKRSALVAFKRDGFKDLFVAWQLDMESRNLAVGTKDYYGRLAQKYLSHLESTGIGSLEEAGASTIFGFLESMKSVWPGTSMYSITTNFRPFLKFLCRQDLIDAVNSVGAKRVHEIIPMLENSDEAAVIRICSSNSVSRKNAAITLLALTTGMRSCDIIGLKLESIDWRAKNITIIQQKTGNLLMLPLLPAVGNALSGYLLNERPRSKDEHVFLREKAPFKRMTDHAAIYTIIKKTFIAAGAKKISCGTRVLRHNVASKMLRSGAALPTIAAVLGHSDPDTTNIYLSTNDECMRQCVLPLPAGAVS